MAQSGLLLDATALNGIGKRLAWCFTQAARHVYALSEKPGFERKLKTHQKMHYFVLGIPYMLG